MAAGGVVVVGILFWYCLSFILVLVVVLLDIITPSDIHIRDILEPIVLTIAVRLSVILYGGYWVIIGLKPEWVLVNPDLSGLSGATVFGVIVGWVGALALGIYLWMADIRDREKMRKEKKERDKRERDKHPPPPFFWR